MNKNRITTNLITVAIVLVATLAMTTSNVAPAHAQGTVTGTLTSVADNVATFEVSAGGKYVLLQEGNNPSEKVTATAKNGQVSFTMKPGNTAMRLENIIATTEVANWQPCSGAADWLCLTEAAPAEPTKAPEPEWMKYSDKLGNCRAWAAGTEANQWNWISPVATMDVCEEGYWLDKVRAGDSFYFAVTVDGATIDPVWGELRKTDGTLVKTWTGVYERVPIAKGEYVFVDTSNAPNAGFRVYTSDWSPMPTKPTEPPKADKPGYCSWFLIRDLAWLLGGCR